jgi:hypothetical protein
MSHRRKDLEIGSVFTDLTILENTYDGKNPGRVRVQCKCGNIFETNKNCVKNGNSKRCFTCGKILGASKKRTGFSELTGVQWGAILSNAKVRNIEVLVTPEYIYNLFILQERRCAISGVILTLKGIKRKPGTASLDRIDSNRPYEEDNLQWVHKDINIAKQSMTHDRFIKMCIVITKFQNNKLIKQK